MCAYTSQHYWYQYHSAGTYYDILGVLQYKCIVVLQCHIFSYWWPYCTILVTAKNAALTTVQVQYLVLEYLVPLAHIFA